MFGLTMLIYVVAAPTLAGIFMMISLVAGKDTGNPIIISVLIGALVAAPVSWLIAKKIMSVEGLVKKS